MLCRKWSVCMFTLAIIAGSKKLDLDPSTIYTVIAFAGAYIGIQGGADAVKSINQKSTPPAP